MSLSIRVYGTIDAVPTIDELIDHLEERDFEITIETEDDDEEDWTELLIFESSVERPLDVTAYNDDNDFGQEYARIKETVKALGETSEIADIKKTISNCTIIVGIELPEEAVDDENALILCCLIGQFIAQKTEGFYCVDEEGFFDSAGDLILEATTADE